MKNDQDFSAPLSIGIEIGGTKTQVGIGSADEGLLPDGIIRRPVRRENGADGILEDVVSMVEEILTSSHLEPSKIVKIGIGFGGILDSTRGVILRSFQVDGWTNFPIKEWAERQWGKPVFVENDANTAGLAESILGNGRGYSRVFYITAGSGVGGSWIVDGRIDNGQGLGAAEIGHMWVADPRSGELSELEQICSGWAIGQRARRAASNDHSLMEELAGSIDQIDAKVVYRAAEEGDETAVLILHETGQTLAVAISNVVALLHPQRVILGGGVSLMGPLFWNDLQKELASRVMPSFAPQVELVPAALGEDVVVVGALWLE
ncbi:MAG TPA: ROK family protein [Anaerolineales bacterium]|nr:ROK family protein [Anaerolineales bacterium]